MSESCKANQIHQDIYTRNYKVLSLSKNNNITFKISFLRKSDSNCKNPNFPEIHISILTRHNAWMQIIITKSNYYKQKVIVDSDPKSDMYPLYTTEKDFYDAPLWYYNIFYKPITKWTANTYALDIDKKNKTIKVFGPIQWGFYFRTIFSVVPDIIEPQIGCKPDIKVTLLMKRTLSKFYQNFQVIFIE